MRNEMRKIVVDRGVMRELMRGSYEQSMQDIAEAVQASSVSLGGPSHLVSTYPNHVILFVEQRGFFKAPYEVTEKGIQLGDPVPYETTTKDSLTRFLEDGDASGVVATILEEDNTEAGHADFSDQLASILRSDRPWRQYLLSESIVENVTNYLGVSPTGMHGRRYVGADGAIQGVTLTRSLVGLQRSLSESLSELAFSVAQYEQKVVSGRTDEETLALEDFDRALSDLVANVDEIGAIVDQGIVNARMGQYQAAARIHDAVMDDISNIHLGQQFAVKMISDLVTV